MAEPKADAYKEYKKDVPQGQEFITKSGHSLKSIYELYSVLSQISEDDFSHHVNAERNDFKNWIQHVIKDEEFALEISAIRDRASLLSAIEARIKIYEEANKEMTDESEDDVKKIIDTNNSLKLSIPEKKKKKEEPKPKVQKETAHKPSMHVHKESIPTQEEEESKTKLIITEEQFSKIKIEEFVIGIIIGVIAGMILARIVFSG